MTKIYFAVGGNLKVYFIIDLIETVAPEMLRTVFDNLEERIALCAAQNVGHLAHLM